MDPQSRKIVLPDMVLIPPCLRHWEKATGGFRISLVIYLIVLVWSAALAIWFLWKYGVRPGPSLGRQGKKKVLES